MNTVLIIDDSDYKRKDISLLLRELFPSVAIHLAESYKSAIRQLRTNKCDLVILDISIPTFDQSGGTWLNFGGRDILMEMVRISLLYPVIVVSQFDEFGSQGEEVSLQKLNEELLTQFRPFYMGAVFYSALDTRWQAGLTKLIQKVSKG